MRVQKGYIEAVTVDDGEYAGMYLEFIHDKDNGQVESRPQARMEYNPSTKQVRLLVWEDPDNEDYTTEITFEKYYDKFKK